MNGATLAAKVGKGYGKAGGKLGLPHTLYRPLSPLSSPLSGRCRLQTLDFISSATPTAPFSRPSKPGEPLRYAYFDAAKTKVGDYINGSTGTFFIASLFPYEQPMVVQCDDVVSITRAAGMQVGLNSAYGGRIDTTDSALVTDWPAYVFKGGHSEAGRAMLPGDPKRFAGAIAMLPPIPGVTIRGGDRLLVQNGDTWIVAGAFLTETGWSLELAGAEA